MAYENSQLQHWQSPSLFQYSLRDGTYRNPYSIQSYHAKEVGVSSARYLSTLMSTFNLEGINHSFGYNIGSEEESISPEDVPFSPQFASTMNTVPEPPSTTEQVDTVSGSHERAANSTEAYEDSPGIKQSHPTVSALPELVDMRHDLLMLGGQNIAIIRNGMPCDNSAPHTDPPLHSAFVAPRNIRKRSGSFSQATEESEETAHRLRRRRTIGPDFPAGHVCDNFVPQSSPAPLKSTFVTEHNNRKRAGTFSHTAEESEETAHCLKKMRTICAECSYMLIGRSPWAQSRFSLAMRKACATSAVHFPEEHANSAPTASVTDVNSNGSFPASNNDSNNVHHNHSLHWDSEAPGIDCNEGSLSKGESVFLTPTAVTFAGNAISPWPLQPYFLSSISVVDNAEDPMEPPAPSTCDGDRDTKSSKARKRKPMRSKNPSLVDPPSSIKCPDYVKAIERELKLASGMRQPVQPSGMQSESSESHNCWDILFENEKDVM